MKDEQLKPDHHEDAKKIIKFTGSVKPGEGEMTRKEQIIEILKAELQAGNIEMIHTNIEQLAEKLALSLDVPSDEEIERQCFGYEDNYPYVMAVWMREEIKKRNS